MEEIGEKGNGRQDYIIFIDPGRFVV